MGKFSFDGVKIGHDTEAAVEKRTLGVKPEFKRFMTGYKDIDEIMGGLPYGISVFYGESGTGKSKLAKAIASKHYTLYLCCESLMDFPDGDVIVMDYTRFLPMWQKALNELLCAIMKYEPNLVIVDSMTTFFSGTKKAVEEADVRTGIFELARKTDGIIPIISTSEVRGSGNYTYEAGGRAVGHAASLLVRFSRIKIGKFTAKKYKAADGDRVYTIDIEKDKQGVAQQGSELAITYDEKNEPHLRRVKYVENDWELKEE